MFKGELLSPKLQLRTFFLSQAGLLESQAKLELTIQNVSPVQLDKFFVGFRLVLGLVIVVVIPKLSPKMFGRDGLTRDKIRHKTNIRK